MSTIFGSSSSAASSQTPPGQPPVQLLDELAEKIERQTMMRFGVERRSHYINTVAARARITKAIDTAAYIRSVLAPLGQLELSTLIDNLTINETTFFRNVPQMNLFARVAVPEILTRKRAKNGPKRIDIWSAACSTGQEAYTLAILAFEALRFLPGWEVRVHATDISPTVVGVARLGVYPKARLDSVPADLLARYFDVTATEIRVKDILRRITTFQQHNLCEAFPSINFDVIFCRNVMIYFSREDQAKLAQKFKDRLVPDGFLFIGHSESLQGLAVDYRLRLEEGSVAYQRPAAD